VHGCTTLNGTEDRIVRVVGRIHFSDQLFRVIEGLQILLLEASLLPLRLLLAEAGVRNAGYQFELLLLVSHLVLPAPLLFVEQRLQDGVDGLLLGSQVSGTGRGLVFDAAFADYIGEFHLLFIQ
jgi:hypothetical protein